MIDKTYNAYITLIDNLCPRGPLCPGASSAPGPPSIPGNPLCRRGPLCPGGLYAREQRDALRADGSPVYRKVSAGDQSSSITVGASEGAAADPGGSEGPGEVGGGSVVLLRGAVLLSDSSVTPERKSGVT